MPIASDLARLAAAALARWLQFMRGVKAHGLTWLALWGAVAGCGFQSPAVDPPGDDDPDGEPVDPDMGACKSITDAAATVIGRATDADEYAVTINAAAASKTSWGTAGNEALVLELTGAGDRLIAHVVMHQGDAAFAYAIHAGALAAGEPIAARVSALSATSAMHGACVTAVLTPAATLGDAAEGLRNAPILRWPVQKRFDDLPVLLGWSKTKQSYEAVFTDQSGGAAACNGGGAGGVQADVAQWGRAADIETIARYGATPEWLRCTGRVSSTTMPVRLEAAHPILYYGDGDNRLFESRAGYGKTCGIAAAQRASGDLAGWNVDNASSELADDAGKVLVLRPLPIDLDALGYATFPGRRDALIDRAAPWLYRISALELAREAKIDNDRARDLTQYLYADVRVSNVGGSGSAYCSTTNGGFVIRVVTSTGTYSSAQQTNVVMQGVDHDWKRVAIAVPAGTKPDDVKSFELDAYDRDGIYLSGQGDAFFVEPSGDAGATLRYVRQGERALKIYVDDDNTDCSGGKSPGPDGVLFDCVGGSVSLAK